MFQAALAPWFGDDDDIALWETAIKTVFAESRLAIGSYDRKDRLIAEIGRCSHWIRPHWRTKKGTAVPAGYAKDVDGFSFHSLPDYDWSLKWMFDADSDTWRSLDRQPSRRPLTHRITIPARTARHPRATVHTIWTPGSPENPQTKLTIVYGFQRCDTNWQLFAVWDHTHQS
ncbi:MAG: hypothetical protein HQ581_08410 [Planctomycetes bacterium]|nr:hypothetical protein [Planctomycetota bacterium]